MNPKKFAKQLEVWRRELIDFSRRNPLLNSNPHSIAVPLGEPTARQILDLVNSGKSVRIHPELIESEENADADSLESKPVVLNMNEVRCIEEKRTRLATNLRTLRRRSEQEFLDKGIRILYLAVGTLHWNDGKEDWSSPILLVPIEFTKPIDDVSYFQLADGDITFNPALVEKLRADLGVDIDPSIDEDAPIEVITRLKSLISGRKNWSVDESAALGIFSFSKEVMFRDLLENEEKILASDLVAALAFGAESGIDLSFQLVAEDELDLISPPSSLSSILDADATQRQAIVAAKSGKSFVIDGPPGSGKSQTIANIIAELISDGRSVLFVSEKAAALEVVHNRLEEAGLGSFLLPLHSQKITRKDFASQLRKAVTERVSTGKKLSSTQRERLTHNQKALSAYAAAMNEVREPLGKSLHEVIGEFAQLNETPDAPLPTLTVTEEMAPDFVLAAQDVAEKLSRTWRQIESPVEFVWRGLRDSKKCQLEKSKISTKIDEAITWYMKVLEQADEIAEDTGIPNPVSMSEFRGLVELITLLQSPEQPPSNWLSSEDFEEKRNLLEKFTKRIAAVQEIREQNCSIFPNWSDLDSEIGIRLSKLEDKVPLESSARLPDCLNIEDFKKLAMEVKNAAVALTSAEKLAEELEERFGEVKVELTVNRAGVLARAASLAASAHRPDALWFSAAGITKAEEAVTLLQPLVDDYWHRARSIESYFKREILELSLESVFPPDSTEPVLGILSSQGRANRKRIAALSLSGKLKKEERDQLHLVRSTQAIEKSLAHKDEVVRPLGSFYYQGVGTDFVALRAALETAKEAVVALKSADPDKLADALSRVALDATQTAEKGSRIESAIRDAKSLAESTFHEDLDDQIDVSRVIERFELIASIWDEAYMLLAPFESTASLSTKTIFDLAKARSRFSMASDDLTSSSPEAVEFLGALYSEAESDVAEIETCLSWSLAVREALPRVPTGSLAERIVSREMFINPEFGTSVHRLESSLRDIDDLFSVDRNLELQFELETEPGRALTYLRLMAEDIEQIDIATDFDDACEEMRSLGLSDVLDYLVHHKVGSQQLASTVIKAISAVWIESIFASDQKRLAPLDRTGRDQAVTDFREIDRKLKFDAASRIADSANNRRPKALIGPVGIIQKQASLKTRHMRIAELLEKTSEVAQSAVPCFMMSPISVSTFLPSTMKFDTVIFDEASQMLTSSAINAIYRARQLIIAGDERQLPPTSFFSRGLDEDDGDEYVEDGIDDFESVLHQAKSGGLEQIGLRWHYRSRHESLITYSNYSFYDGQLVTYPSAIQDSPELGVSFVHVPNGIYKRSGSRTNTIEAQKVVERVLYFADHHPELSLGVVTLSAQQKTEIENQLDAALRVRPDLEEYFTADRLHGVFVKNLESVQGDERDVIIFSVGYGKDENGKLTMNFGPVNIKGGWRRLNVAFTRARNRMELVASIAAGDFSDTANPNVNHLKRYFDYAVRGPSALAFEVGESNLGPESPFEEEVIQVIRLLGYDPVPQVGQAGYRIDMAIKDPKNPGSFVLGIECDGAAYHSSRVARDRDRLRQDVLEGLGWNLYRIWGPTWYRNRKQAERDLHSAISAAVQSKRTIVSSKPEVSRTSIQHTTTDVEFTELSDFVRPYFLPNRRWDVPLNTNATGHVTPIGIQQFILAVVKEEGPVSINLVKRRFAIAAGWNLTKAVQADLERRIKRMIRDKELLKVKPECLILPRELDFVARKPDETDELTKRDASNVAYIEIGAAIVNFLRLASPIDLSEIEQLVVKSVFGWDRVTAKWKDAIGETISALAAHGWWSVVGDQICKGGNFPHTATTVTFK